MRKKKATRKNRGPEVSVRKYKAMMGPSAFEVWIEKESVFCGHDMDADTFVKILRKIGIGVNNKNLLDPPNHDISGL